MHQWGASFYMTQHFSPNFFVKRPMGGRGLGAPLDPPLGYLDISFGPISSGLEK